MKEVAMLGLFLLFACGETEDTTQEKEQEIAREKKRWLFGNSTFCSKCGEKITFLSFPKPTFEYPVVLAAIEL